jgi:hypothetical protein
MGEDQAAEDDVIPAAADVVSAVAGRTHENLTGAAMPLLAVNRDGRRRSR